MAASSPRGHGDDLTESTVNIPSDSESYSHNHDQSPSVSHSSSGSPMILYSPPTIWGLLRGAGINLLLPFVNGLMLGFGELLAHEAAFRLGWGGTKVRPLASAIHPCETMPFRNLCCRFCPMAGFCGSMHQSSSRNRSP